MHAFRIEIGNQAQADDLGPALEHALAGEGPVGHVGLAEAGLQRAAGDAGDIGQ